MVRSTLLSLCCLHLNSSAVDKSQGRESNLGPLGEKRERYPLCYTDKLFNPIEVPRAQPDRRASTEISEVQELLVKGYFEQKIHYKEKLPCT